jgi:hypothetical protein
VALIIHLHLAPVLKNDRWENDIKMDLQEVGWGETDWIYLAHDMNNWQAVVNAVINLQGP